MSSAVVREHLFQLGNDSLVVDLKTMAAELISPHRTIQGRVISLANKPKTIKNFEVTELELTIIFDDRIALKRTYQYDEGKHQKERNVTPDKTFLEDKTEGRENED